MNYNKYPNYKPSGIEWIGDIPEHWEVKRLKYVVRYQKGKNPNEMNVDGKGKVYLTMEYLRSVAKQIFYVEDYEKYINVTDDDILLLWDGSNAGEFVKGKEGILSSTMAKLVVVNFNESYVWYFFKSFERLLKLFTIGMGVPHVSSEDFENQLIIIPPLAEQTAIANFLDDKTAKIDSLIEKKKKLIELYKEERTAVINQAVTRGINPNVKLKPSGIDWLGNIPEHWEVKKLKYVAKIYGRIGYRGYTIGDMVNEGEGAITLSPSNMVNGYMDYNNCAYISLEKYEESPEIKIFNGDIVFVKTGSTFGKTALVTNLEEKVTINPQLIVFKEIKIDNKFLLYLFISELVQYQVNISVIGGTIPTISQEKINNYLLIIPPIYEQQQIIEYIEAEMKRIDEKIKRTEKEIELLQEYRTALISEVVTGKIDVRNAV
uniref:Restriction endonuclease subunit S n=1 Tax=Ignavibacterium album TaxID=591197 RepID=A0A7V2ZKN1_9BACT